MRWVGLLLGLSACWPGPLERLADPGGIPIGTFQSLTPCLDGRDYVASGNVVSFGGGFGDNYNPKCLTVHVNAGVSFAGDFNTHPLRASTRGSAGNPIQATNSGSIAPFSFTSAGFYPYYCSQHGDNSGANMAGVIQVVP